MSLQLHVDSQLLRTLHKLFRMLFENGGEASIDTLAEKLGINTDELRKLLDKLAESDVITVTDDTVKLNVDTFGEFVRKAVESGIVKPEEAEKLAQEMEEMAKRCAEREGCSKEMEEKTRRVAEELQQHIHAFMEKTGKEMYWRHHGKQRGRA